MYPCNAADCNSFDFVPASYRIKLATEAWEKQASVALRRSVFCGEQGLFNDDDSDAIDAHALTLVAVSCIAGMSEQVVGTVRIHNSLTSDPDANENRLWYGSRLAVHRDYRSMAWLGSELIHLAVSMAHARGCTRFLAQVQLRNVKLFRHLHWQSIEETQVCGRPHHLMQADLAHYPPCHDAELGFVTTLRRAA
jgi:putative N-acetyltransferase (TIGR04045 family)